MIGKQIISNGFGATSKYVLGKEDAEVLDTNMAGDTYTELAQEFSAIARLRPNNNRACLHAVLSLPHREDNQGEVTAHESLNNNQWVEVGQRWLEEMGFTDNQYLMVRHHDTKHEHLHIVANRIRLDGDVVSDSYNYFRSEAVIRKIEQDYELEAVTPSWETHRRAPTTPELKEFERTGTDSVRLTIAELAQQAAADRPTMPEYIDRMKELGVEVKVNITRSDKVRGISYSMGAYAFQGSDIGKDYSWNGLQQYDGVSYVQSRDFETISQGKSRTSNSKSRSARTSQQNADGDRTIESADQRSDSGKQLVETAVSRFTQSTDDFSRRLERTNSNSRKRTEQPERELATAPSGAGSKSRTAASSQIDITKELDQLGSTVEQVNSELELQIGQHREPSSNSRTASRTASAEQSRTNTTTKSSEANVQQQLEEINRVHQGRRRKRREKFQQFELDFTAGNNQPESKNEFDRTAVNEPESAKELAKTIDELGKLQQYIASGITRFNTELRARTQRYRVEIGYPGEQSEERQTIGVYSLEDAQRGNSEKHQPSEHSQQKDRAVGNPETGSVLVGDVSRNQYHCTLMLASNIDSLILKDTDKYDDGYFTAERVSPTEISLRCSSDQREILRARYIGGEDEDWQALPCEREMTSDEVQCINALTENIIKQLEGEHWEQQEFVSILAPSIATLLDIKETTRLVGKRYIAEWSEPFLTIEEIGNPKLIMKAEWNDDRELWFEAGSNLTAEITDYLSEKAELLIEKATQQSHEQQSFNYIPPPIHEQRQLEL